MNEYMGIEQGLTGLSGMASVYELELCRAGEAVDLGEVSFAGLVWCEGAEYEVVVSCTDEVGVLRVEFPLLDAGEYRYELVYYLSDGSACRLAYGRLGVLASGMLLDEAPVASAVKRMRLVLPGEAGGRIVGRWRSVQVTEAAASVCREAAEVCRSAEESVAKAADVAEAFEGVMSKAVVPNQTTGTWWVGGYDTGCAWHGADGVDADKVRRYVVGDVSELPAEGSGGEYYYVEVASGYDVYVWLLSGGVGSWVKVDGVTEIAETGHATTGEYGVVRLAANVVVGDGELVPTGGAVAAYVEGELAEYVKAADVTDHVNLEKVAEAGFVKAADVEGMGYAKEADVADVVRIAGGGRMVVLSEAEYEALGAIEDDVFYLTY